VATQAEALSPGPRGFGSPDDRQPLAGLKTSPSRQRGRARTAPCPSVAVDKADRFWPDVTRLVVAIGIAVLILAVIGIYISSMTFMESSG
jgi:hypothetical protein